MFCLTDELKYRVHVLPNPYYLFDRLECTFFIMKHLKIMESILFTSFDTHSLIDLHSFHWKQMNDSVDDFFPFLAHFTRLANVLCWYIYLSYIPYIKHLTVLIYFVHVSTHLTKAITSDFLGKVTSV